MVNITKEKLEEIKTQAIASKYLAEAYQLSKAKEFMQAIEMLSKVLGVPGITSELKANALINRATTYGRLEPPKTKEAIVDCTVVVEMPDVSVQNKARALLNRASTYSRLESPKMEKAIADCTTVIEMPDVSAEKKAEA